MGLFCRLPTDETLEETYFAWNHAGWVKNVILSPGPTLPCLCAIYMTLINTLNSGLLNTYKSLFSLDDSLADIKTRADLLEYLGDVSSRARDLQPTSSSYFVEETGEVKLLSGE